MSEDDVRVVVVDDFIDAAEALAETLMISGYKVWVATDGAGALALIETHQPHCVLLDIGMPGMDGNELTRTLRTRYGDDIVLIAVTGREHDDERVSDTFARVLALDPIIKADEARRSVAELAELERWRLMKPEAAADQLYTPIGPR